MAGSDGEAVGRCPGHRVIARLPAVRHGPSSLALRAARPADLARPASAAPPGPQATTTTGQPARSRRRRWARYGDGSRAVTTTTVVPGRTTRRIIPMRLSNGADGCDVKQARKSQIR